MDLIEAIYRQNEWANLRLLEVCRGLTDDQLKATAPGAFGSVRATLQHLVGAEALNVRRLGGSPALEIPAREGAWPGFEALETSVRESAAGLVERARTVGGSRIVVEEDGARVEIEANVMLVQVINHSTDHRSQVCTILSELGVLAALPEAADEGQTIVDAWAWADALGLARRLG